MDPSTNGGKVLRRSASKLLRVTLSRLVEGDRSCATVGAFVFACGAFCLGHKLNTGIPGTSSSQDSKATSGKPSSSIGKKG